MSAATHPTRQPQTPARPADQAAPEPRAPARIHPVVAAPDERTRPHRGRTRPYSPSGTPLPGAPAPYAARSARPLPGPFGAPDAGAASPAAS